METGLPLMWEQAGSSLGSAGTQPGEGNYSVTSLTRVSICQL